MIFSDGALADAYATRMRDLPTIVTPVIILYEVYKRLKRDLSEDDAVVAISAMQRSRVVAITGEIALTAADRLSLHLSGRGPHAEADAVPPPVACDLTRCGRRAAVILMN